jgi:hypothetical protein
MMLKEPVRIRTRFETIPLERLLRRCIVAEWECRIRSSQDRVRGREYAVESELVGGRLEDIEDPAAKIVSRLIVRAKEDMIPQRSAGDAQED